MTDAGPVISLEHDGNRDILTIDNSAYVYSWKPIHPSAAAVNYYYDKLGRKFVTRHNKVKHDIFETYRALFIRKLLIDPFPIMSMNFDDINRFMDGLQLRDKYGSNLLYKRGEHVGLDYIPSSAKTLEVMCALAQRMSRMILLPSNGDISAIFLLDMLDNLELIRDYSEDYDIENVYYNIHDIFGERTSGRSLWDQAFNYISWYLGPTKILTEQLNGFKGLNKDKYLDILYRVGVKGYLRYAGSLNGNIPEDDDLSGYKSIVNLVK